MMSIRHRSGIKSGVSQEQPTPYFALFCDNNLIDLIKIIALHTTEINA